MFLCRVRLLSMRLFLCSITMLEITLVLLSDHFIGNTASKAATYSIESSEDCPNSRFSHENNLSRIKSQKSLSVEFGVKNPPVRPKSALNNGGVFDPILEVILDS